MKKILVALGLWLGLTAAAQAQCISAQGAAGPAPQAGFTCASEPVVPTYAATAVALVPAASATDIACLTGAAGKVIRVQLIRVSGSAGTLITVPVLITKHASANTGGTPATSTALPVPYPLDANNVTVAATTTAWTANPTIADSSPGIIDSSELTLNTTAANVNTGYANFDYSERNFSQAPVLRGVAQQVCVNLNAVSITSGSVNITFKWTEQAQ